MGYTDRKNILILIAALKGHGIKRIVISPGATNVMFVGSVQQDPWFEIYSSIDERSAAYIACGLAEKYNEPVALSCTGATASRNYMPGLTEAYYRKLPVLAITSLMANVMIGMNTPQVIDRTAPPSDIAKISVTLNDVHDASDYWKCVLLANKAILELTRDGGGPAHIQLPGTFSSVYDVETLPTITIMKRFTPLDELSEIPKGKKIAIRVGAHKQWTSSLTSLVDDFCSKYDAVVLCDHSSGYHGQYRVLEALIGGQEALDSSIWNVDLLIDIGEITANYFVMNSGEVWRVSPDGEMKDRYKKLTNTFEMEEETFFRYYTEKHTKSTCEYYDKLDSLYKHIFENIPELPFSNVWIAQQLHDKLPCESSLHLGILNSIRSWNFFEIESSIYSSCNTGGFGIDGALSTALGIALSDREHICFCILGDLAFFYDMNALGNRYLPNNMRIILINNGVGTEFKNYWHPGAVFGDKTDDFIAAGRHYGNKSRALVKHYATDLGFDYMKAENKEEFMLTYRKFITADGSNKPMLMEVFTNPEDESEALKLIRNIVKGDFKHNAKKEIKQLLGKNTISKIKNIFGKR